MASAYYALTASLPMLKRDEDPSMTSEAFLSACSAFVEPELMTVLESLSLCPSDTSGLDPESAAYSYEKWEIALRNSMAKIRANKLKLDPSAHVLKDADYDSEADRIANDALSAPNPMEKEKILDAGRWYKLDCMEGGHLFDFDVLCIYRYKLMILEKWQSRKSEKAAGNLDAAATRIQSKGA